MKTQTLKNMPAMTDLVRKIVGSNNGYIFAPSGGEIACAKLYRHTFALSPNAMPESWGPYVIRLRSPLGLLEGADIEEANQMLADGLANVFHAIAYRDACNAGDPPFLISVEHRPVTIPSFADGYTIQVPFLTINPR